MYPYAVVGNCSLTALIDTHGSIDWLCLPSPDSPPFFGRLLDRDGGRMSVSTVGPSRAQQRYRGHTNILETTIEDAAGSFRIVDFCPRYHANGRVHRPRELYRMIEPVGGQPEIIISCTPVAGWEKSPLKPHCSANAIHFESGAAQATLTTTIGPHDVIEERPVKLTEPIYAALTCGSEPVGDLTTIVRDALDKTEAYWRTWVRHCSVATLFQAETIRSALALKLHCCEDTGAIIAAPTTSLPEEVGGERNWDYRFCWLRDAAFVLSAFHHLGHFDEMEGFLRFLLRIAEAPGPLQPVYRANGAAPLPEEVHLNWRGYKNSAPVRSNNQAAEHVQNDVYGEMIVALTPIFFDERFADLRTREHEDLMGYLAMRAAATLGEKDAGLWEYRSNWQVHSFSTLMSWAGLERIERLQGCGFFGRLDLDVRTMKAKAAAIIESAVVDGSLRNGPADPSFDASLLLLPMLRYPDRGLNERTVRAVWRALRAELDGAVSPYMYRYRRTDDFGAPRSAFVICSFWLIEALARVGHRHEAEELMGLMRQTQNKVGLIAEHFDPAAKEQAGNFPQAYSHVGAINAAFAVSPPWRELL